MELLATRNRAWMAEADAGLLAAGLTPRWEVHRASGVAVLDVAASDVEVAAGILSALLGEAIGRQKERRELPPINDAPLLLQPAFAAAFCAGVAILMFYRVTGPFHLSTPWFAKGALITQFAEAGEWWRMITASTLHADAAHAVGNAIFLWVLGWAAAERTGPGVMIASMLLTAVAGMAVSLAFSDTHSTVGASGGMFGLLGVSGGHGLRWAGESLQRPHGKLRSVGAAVMLLGFTAFGPKSNIHAHVGGFVAGMLVGWLTPKVAPSKAIQLLCAVVTALAIGWAWTAAGFGVLG